MEERVLHEAEGTKYYEVAHWSRVGRKLDEAVVNRIWTMDLQKPPIVVTSRDLPSHLTARQGMRTKGIASRGFDLKYRFALFLEH